MNDPDDDAVAALRQLDRDHLPEAEARARIEERMWAAHARASTGRQQAGDEGADEDPTVLVELMPVERPTDDDGRGRGRGRRLAVVGAAIAASVALVLAVTTLADRDRQRGQLDAATSPQSTAPPVASFGDEIDGWCQAELGRLVAAVEAWNRAEEPEVALLRAVVDEVGAATAAMGELALDSGDPEAMLRLNELAALGGAAGDARQALGTPAGATGVADLVDALGRELRAAGAGGACDLPSLRT